MAERQPGDHVPGDSIDQKFLFAVVGQILEWQHGYGRPVLHHRRRESRNRRRAGKPVSFSLPLPARQQQPHAVPQWRHGDTGNHHQCGQPGQQRFMAGDPAEKRANTFQIFGPSAPRREG
ncbi:MAG TPA: hypothetical protein VII49_10495 [Rhizomicrobium sp.]